MNLFNEKSLKEVEVNTWTTAMLCNKKSSKYFKQSALSTGLKGVLGIFSRRFANISLDLLQ